MNMMKKKELVFYSKGTTDIEYKFPFGWGEVWGIADRTDYDLSRHMEATKEDMNYLDPETNEKYIPYVIEPSVGVDRMVLLYCVIVMKNKKLQKEMLEQFYICIQQLHHLKQRYFHYQRN